MTRSQTTATTKQENRPAPRASRGPSDDEIRVRAYEIYLARGGQPGRERDDWEQARRELSQQAPLLAR